MIVKQIYAGWVGVIAGDKCHNGVIEFDLNEARRQQLEPYQPTDREAAMLRTRLIESKPYGHECYTSQLVGVRC